jgi:hypothetical protein
MVRKIYKVQIRPHTHHRGCFGWAVLENGNPVRHSDKPYRSETEANTDGLAVVRELDSLQKFNS